jgi:hypothetical protein
VEDGGLEVYSLRKVGGGRGRMYVYEVGFMILWIGPFGGSGSWCESWMKLLITMGDEMVVVGLLRTTAWHVSKHEGMRIR